MIASEPPEEDLQKFLKLNPGFIAGLLGGPDNSDLAILFKPRIGNQHIADFALIQAHQGGAVVHLVEIFACSSAFGEQIASASLDLN
ncbi:MAG: hypothetical protein AAFO68_03175, partial [Pseudomonadota bacterium]